MSKWVFCKDSSKVALDQIKSQQFNRCFCFQQKQKSQLMEQKYSQKVIRKKSLKSLKSSESLKQLKGETKLNKNTNFQPQNPLRKPIMQEQTILIPRYQQSHVYYRQPNLIVQPKMKVNLIHFDPQVSEAYCYYPQIVRVERVPLRPSPQAFGSQKVIDYRPFQSKLHSFQPSTQGKSSQQTPVKQKDVVSFLELQAISKNSNKFYSQAHCKRSKNQAKISQISKSADFRQINISRESRINLHKIKCVRAVSINDSSTSQQQVSILVQPTFKGLNLKNEV